MRWMQAAGQKRGRPTPKGHVAVPEPSPTLLDKRPPTFTTGCIKCLLDAVVDDGVVPASQLMEVSPYLSLPYLPHDKSPVFHQESS
jgi:hypothetical protein